MAKKRRSNTFSVRPFSVLNGLIWYTTMETRRIFLVQNYIIFFSGDACGFILKMIQDSVEPKSAFEFIQGLVEFFQTKAKR